MSDSDDMVLVVELEEFDTNARRRAKTDSLHDRSLRKKGKRLQEIRQLRRRQQVRNLLSIRKQTRAAARLALNAGGRMATNMAGRALGETGGAVGLPLALLLIAGAVTLRLTSGKSFEQMGDMMNKMILGDHDDAARAAMRAREELTGNEYVANFARIYGVDALKPTFDRIYERKLTEERGASIIREQYGVNNIFDILILRMRDMLVGAWREAGGEALMQRIGFALQQADPNATGGMR